MLLCLHVSRASLLGRATSGLQKHRGSVRGHCYRPMLLYLHVFRELLLGRTTSGLQKHRGQCPWTLLPPDAPVPPCLQGVTTRANYFRLTEASGAVSVDTVTARCPCTSMSS